MPDSPEALDAPVTRLWPAPQESCPLRGLYLAHQLRDLAGSQPFVYTNFVVSLDGRIALANADNRRREVPRAIANGRDWRLYMELGAQADVIVTTARNLRAVAQGRYVELLDFAAGGHPDLADWRRTQGLAPQPVIAVVSAALDFPAEQVQARLDAPLLAITGEAADAERLYALRAAGVEVLQCGRGRRVDGRAMLAQLGERGLRTVYSIAGPGILNTLLAAGGPQRLYLTQALCMLGGSEFDTIMQGPPLVPAPGFGLHSLYLDSHAPAGAAQLLCTFERAPAKG